MDTTGVNKAGQPVSSPDSPPAEAPSVYFYIRTALCRKLLRTHLRNADGPTDDILKVSAATYLLVARLGYRLEGVVWGAFI